MLGVAGAALTCAAWPSRAIADVAVSVLPRRSDIVVSIRNAAASADQALGRYRPTRLEWHYVTDPGFVRREKARFGIGYASGTINANVGKNANPADYARDFDGGMMSAPWMAGWGAMWVSVASNASRARLLANVDAALAAGCDGIQVDDGWYQLVSEEWGGDFSDASRAGFGAWLDANSSPDQRVRLSLPASTRGFDYRDWLRTRGIRANADYVAHRKGLATTPLWRRYLAANVRDFWKALRAHVDAGGRGVPLSINLGAALPNDNFMGLADLVDYTMSELPAGDDPFRYRLYGASAEAADLPFVGLFIDRPDSGSFRQNIAVAYASGIVPAAPWDVFVSNRGAVKQPRLFSDPAGYADLYDFVRARRALFDGFGDAARIGLAVPVNAYAGRWMEPLARALFAAGVPYRILPVGGSYRDQRLDPAALAGLSTLVLSHPAGSYGSGALARLRASGLPVVEAVDADLLDGETVGAPLNRADWALLHRRDAGLGRSVLHLVPQRFGAGAFSGVVRLRHGTSARVEQVTRIRLHRPGRPNALLAPTTRSAAASLYQLPTVDDWAVLELLEA